MNKVIKTIKTAAIISLTLFSINANAMEGHHSHGEKAKAENKAENKEKKRSALSETTKEKLVSLLKSNESLHAAFYEYDAKKAEPQAKKLISIIDSINDAKVDAYLSKAKANLAKISAKNDKDANYELYSDFSDEMVKILTKYDLGTSYNVYTCPMIKKDWIQNSDKMSKVHNPYAPYMPHCGTQKTKFI